MKPPKTIIDPETAKLIESLQVHQVELEMQNEQLRITKERADLATEKYIELYDFAPLGYFTLSAEGVILELNLSGSQLLGKERKNLINSLFGNFVSVDTKPLFNQLLESIFLSKKKETCEITLIPAGLPVMFVQLSGIILGNGISCLLTAVDITSRKKSEDQLVKSRLFMQSSLESQKEMIFLSVDTEYRYLYFNSAHCQLIKQAYNQEIEVGLSLLECVTSENDRVLTKNHLDRALNGEAHSKIWKFDNGSLNYYETFFNPIVNENAVIIGVTAISRDVSSRKRNEELLKESKIRLDKSQQMARLGSWELDLLSGQLFWSDEVYRIFGLLPQEFAANHNAFMESVHPDDRDALNMAYFGSIDNNDPGYTLEHRIIRRHTGEIRYVYEKCEHIRNDEGQIIRSIGMVQDITERKMAESALIESREKYRDLVELAVDGVMVGSADGIIIEANNCLCTMLGIDKNELVGTYFANLIFPGENKVFVNSGQIGFGEVVVIDRKFLRPDGNQISIEIRTKVMPNRTYQSIFRDITERKRTEQALRDSEAQITALLAAIPDMIFVMNNEGVYMDYHGAVSEELYVKPEYFIGKNISEVLPPELAHQFSKAYEKALLTNEVQLCEYSLPLSDGVNYYEGKVVAYAESKWLTIIRNVSLYKLGEAGIKLKNEDLQRINAEKDKFFSIIAHDLRGPFSGFLALTEVLAKRLPDMTLKEIQEITLMMRNSAVHLFRLLGNLLEWSRMQRGLIDFTPKSINLESVFSECLVIANESAQLKGITITYEPVKDLTVLADKNMLESILRNLLSNSVKFTQRGGRVNISTLRCSDDRIEILIQDSGIGMSQQMLSQLFQIGTKSNRKGTEGESSSGLGLMLCKDFIEKNGGILDVASEEGKGSTFRVTLPTI